MSYDNEKNGKDIGMDLSTFVIWEVGILFVIILVVMTIYLYGLYLRVENAENARKLYTPRLAEVANTKLEQQYKITSYSWVDHEQGLVSIPIELAMSNTASMLAQERQAATRIEAVSTAIQPALVLSSGGLGETEATPGE